ncbi:MAG: hypothetical protein JXB26_09225 [Candidatus Aminicenantes bacterium]|nr:hypothetical protein [Candidatus Aminicenantes bacterium]
MNSVLVFNLSGKLLYKFGLGEKSTSRIVAPLSILPEKDHLIIQNAEKNSLEYFDFNGNYLKR